MIFSISCKPSNLFTMGEGRRIVSYRAHRIKELVMLDMEFCLNHSRLHIDNQINWARVTWWWPQIKYLPRSLVTFLTSSLLPARGSGEYIHGILIHSYPWVWEILVICWISWYVFFQIPYQISSFVYFCPILVNIYIHTDSYTSPGHLALAWWSCLCVSSCKSLLLFSPLSFCKWSLNPQKEVVYLSSLTNCMNILSLIIPLLVW